MKGGTILSRKKVLIGGKREEIIEVALRLFMEFGFEQTSIRMIIQEAGGEIGMFYHYFKSKHEVFDVAVQHYLNKYVESYKQIAEDDSETVTQQLASMSALLKKAGTEYALLLKEHSMHWTIQHALHDRTVKSLEPYMAMILQRGINEGVAENVLGLPMDTLAACMIHGIEGILHVHDGQELTEDAMNRTESEVYRFVEHMLRISMKKGRGING